ncbi:MAG TPA: hypothetical protein VI039_12775 [Solirubrobacterales bacterium]
MIPMLEFKDCTARQVRERIEEATAGDTLARKVVVKTDFGEVVIGTFEGIADDEVRVEVDEAAQTVFRVPCALIAAFGEYVPPLNRGDEVRG